MQVSVTTNKTSSILVVFANLIDQNNPPQHSRNLFYHFYLIMQHLQVILQEHSSRLNLIINTLPQTKTGTAPQIQMTSTHV